MRSITKAATLRLLATPWFLSSVRYYLPENYTGNGRGGWELLCLLMPWA